MKKKCKCGEQLPTPGFKMCRSCHTKQNYCLLAGCFQNDYGGNCFCKHHLEKYHKRKIGGGVSEWIESIWKD